MMIRTTTRRRDHRLSSRGRWARLARGLGRMVFASGLVASFAAGLGVVLLGIDRPTLKLERAVAPGRVMLGGVALVVGMLLARFGFGSRAWEIVFNPNRRAWRRPLGEVAAFARAALVGLVASGLV